MRCQDAGFGNIDRRIVQRQPAGDALDAVGRGQIQRASKGHAIDDIAPAATGTERARTGEVHVAADRDGILHYYAAGAGHDLAAGIANNVRVQEQCAAVERGQRCIVGGSAIDLQGDRPAGDIGRDGAVIGQRGGSARIVLLPNEAGVAMHGDAGSQREIARLDVQAVARVGIGKDNVAVAADRLVALRCQNAGFAYIRRTVQRQPVHYSLDAVD